MSRMERLFAEFHMRLLESSLDVEAAPMPHAFEDTHDQDL